ncbi:MAG TPA: DUF4377 domain-containing protein [Candidatus Alistipes stercorigallinarum]|nr:DUF4377 domain-containing protein [Candidatus Alistipes stercorigallinarum]
MKRSLLLFASLLALLFTSCAKDEERVEVWTVASEMGIVHGVFNLQPALMIRTDESTDWRPMLHGIEGFDYEPGYEYRIRVRLNARNEPMADGASLKYTLAELYDKRPASSQLPAEYFPEFTMEIGPHFSRFHGVDYLSVRLPDYGVVTEWQPWPWPIEGLDYEEGHLYRLRVGTSVTPAPEDAEGRFTVKYTLLELLDMVDMEE